MHLRTDRLHGHVELFCRPRHAAFFGDHLKVIEILVTKCRTRSQYYENDELKINCFLKGQFMADVVCFFYVIGSAACKVFLTRLSCFLFSAFWLG